MTTYNGRSLVPARLRPGVRCHAHRSTDGRPCEAFACHGQYVCWSHGGASPQARAAARFRLEEEFARLEARRFVAQVMAELRREQAERRERLWGPGWRHATAYAAERRAKRG